MVKHRPESEGWEDSIIPHVAHEMAVISGSSGMSISMPRDGGQELSDAQTEGLKKAPIRENL